MNKIEIEYHPLHPFLPGGARLLMLGSFPPPRKRWSFDFFYPNRSNMMWEIFGLVFYGDSQQLVDAPNKTFRLEDIKALLNEREVSMPVEPVKFPYYRWDDLRAYYTAKLQRYVDY